MANAGINYGHIINLIFKSEGLQRTKASINDYQNAINRLKTMSAKDFEELGKQTGKVIPTMQKGKAVTDEWILALRRAAVVAPVWMLARSAMVSVIQTIQAGIKYTIDLESALARAENVSRGYSGTSKQAMRELSSMAENYGRVHAGTAKDVIEAYYRMATAGATHTEAMAAAIPITKLAMATYGDVATVGREVSGIFRLLGDTIEGATTDQEKMLKITGALAVAYRDHEVETNEMAASIAKAGAQGAAFGMSMQEIIAVLAVANNSLIKGGQAGTLFGRILDDMAKHLDKVQEMLGQTFDPNKKLDWFKILMDLIGKLKAEGMGTLAIETKLSEMFETRGKRELRVLVSEYDKLQDTLKNVTENSDGVVEAMLAVRDATAEVQFKNIEETISILLKDFMTGATGAEDFAKGLKNINTVLGELRLNFALSGTLINTWVNNLSAGIELLSSKRTFGDVIKDIQKEGISGLFKSNNGLDIYGSKVKDMEDVWSQMEKMFDGETSFNERLAKQKEKDKQKEKGALEEAAETQRDLTLKEQQKINLQTLELKYLYLQNKGYSDIQISQQKVVDYVQLTVNALKEQGKEVDKTSLLTAVMQQDWEKVKELTASSLVNDSEISKMSKLVNDIYKERLKLQKDINEEKKKGKTFDSDALKLMELAKKFGLGTAQNISQYLMGKTDLDQLSKKEQGIVKSNFSSKFEQEMAKKFYEGEGFLLDYPGKTKQKSLPSLPSIKSMPTIEKLTKEALTPKTETKEIKTEAKTDIYHHNVIELRLDKNNVIKVIDGRIEENTFGSISSPAKN